MQLKKLINMLNKNGGHRAIPPESTLRVHPWAPTAGRRQKQLAPYMLLGQKSMTTAASRGVCPDYFVMAQMELYS